MEITAEAIKEQQSKIAEMIKEFKAKNPVTIPFPATASTPELNEGEKHVGCIISADGNFREHIILLPGEKSETGWVDAMDWAKSIGGELPGRVEFALLFATMRDQFLSDWYWSSEQSAHYDGFVWKQSFYDGFQLSSLKSDIHRARAIRRLLIID